MTSPKILTAPDGWKIRAAHIVSVTPLFESTDLGTDAFAVFTVGSDEPFQFAAPFQKNSEKRKAMTAAMHEEFINAWVVALDGSPYFKN